MPKKRLFFSFMICFVCGILIGYFIFSIQNAPRTNIVEQRGKSSYNYINPLLECDQSESTGNVEFGQLEKDLQDYISSHVSLRGDREISVYFRNLKYGTWIGVNEKEQFNPASLLKVPLAISIYETSEENETFLQKKIPLTDQDQRTAQQMIPYYPPLREIVPGTEYSIEELITRMLQYSDNSAWYLLMKNTDEGKFIQTFRDLGMLVPSSEDYITVKDYASVFRILYNASYLSGRLSNKLLDSLTHTEFDGIPHGLPKTMKIAHKFGERLVTNDIKQLHDCGIIYYPDHPYLLCIMTRGNDYPTQQKIIQDVSKIVFKSVDERFKAYANK